MNNPMSVMPMAVESNNSGDDNASAMTRWLKTAGTGAFVFFTLKGLAWLLVPALMYWLR